MTLVKIPVVLAEPKVQVDIEQEITFPEPVLEIKKVKKRLKLTQCRLLYPTNKLFIRGFVRKNIQYATPTSATEKSVTSNIRSLTVDIPFSETVEIKEFINPPAVLRGNTETEFGYLKDMPLPAGFPGKDKLLANDLSEHDMHSIESFNELPYCELTGSATFVEYDEALNRIQGRVISHQKCHDGPDAPFEEGTFTRLLEKMVVEFTVKVLQKQQLNVSTKPAPVYDGCFSSVGTPVFDCKEDDKKKRDDDKDKC
ncbi:DUF3794 domain-containing protein [Bacillus marinisedimentorum]|uniref:DUF3794 domain-containing protein n=1 Tax=Bacillus marinisedimentorum TaxID=1821260 RepID=UPI000872588F|nr:DUF3794 domain-containing protein [Bacillus marinisedimentorum]